VISCSRVEFNQKLTINPTYKIGKFDDNQHTTSTIPQKSTFGECLIPPFYASHCGIHGVHFYDWHVPHHRSLTYFSITRPSFDYWRHFFYNTDAMPANTMRVAPLFRALCRGLWHNTARFWHNIPSTKIANYIQKSPRTCRKSDHIAGQTLDSNQFTRGIFAPTISDI